VSKYGNVTTKPPVQLIYTNKNVFKNYSYLRHSAKYENGKMRPVETIPGMGGEIKESRGGGEFKYDIIDKL
jgi:hypothetical protein